MFCIILYQVCTHVLNYFGAGYFINRYGNLFYKYYTVIFDNSSMCKTITYFLNFFSIRNTQFYVLQIAKKLSLQVIRNCFSTVYTYAGIVLKDVLHLYSWQAAFRPHISIITVHCNGWKRTRALYNRNSITNRMVQISSIKDVILPISHHFMP